jgi:hypothetical protein
VAIPTTTTAIKEVIVASRKFPIVPRIVKVKQYHTNFPFYTNILQKHIDFALRIGQEKRLSCVSKGIVSYWPKRPKEIHKKGPSFLMGLSDPRFREDKF